VDSVQQFRIDQNVQSPCGSGLTILAINSSLLAANRKASYVTKLAPPTIPTDKDPDQIIRIDRYPLPPISGSKERIFMLFIGNLAWPFMHNSTFGSKLFWLHITVYNTKNRLKMINFHRC
jgi:hypothetical protein